MSDAVIVPELPDDLEWVNTDSAPSLADNRGRVVLLVFWTYSNINCRHVLANMRELQTRYEGSLAIVGIHSPRFAHEEQGDNVLKAVNRWHVRIPVAIDNRFRCWQRYGVSAWPSILVADCEGRVRKVFEGDDQERGLETLIDQLLLEASVSDYQLPGDALTAHKPEPRSQLRFPSHLVSTRGSLFISDSGNNRILELAEDGRIRRVFGSGNSGLWDGFLDNSGFNSPTGLAHDDQHLYVADTGNHAIRRIKLMSGEVETLAGNGHIGRDAVRNHTEMRQVSLASPTGLALSGARLFVTMTGLNQIWQLELDVGAISWLSGSGQNTVKDGPAGKAGYASPQGLAANGQRLLVVDAEGSAIREVSMSDGKVRTLLGSAGEYTYGMVDGNPHSARLQYPTDIAVSASNDRAWIVDSFNGRLRQLDLHRRELTTPDLGYLNEPRGIHLTGALAWIANTNNHCVTKIDLEARGSEDLVVRNANV